MIRKFLGLVLFAALTASGPASGGADAAAVLKAVEDRSLGALAPKDVQALMVMTINQGGAVKTREIRAWTRNNEGKDDYRVMKFLSPADVQGVGFLVLAEDAMYIYLPEFHRTRRIASSNKKDAFMGSDFSYEDMGTGGFSRAYDPALLREDDKTWTLELKRKPGADKPYARLVMTVDKAVSMAVRLECYDSGGGLWKTIEQKPEKIGTYWIATTIKVSDAKKGSFTVLEMRDVKPDQRLGDDIFTERFLVRRLP
jgi:outer membrane lipoprotein-sorting protein